MTTTQVLWGLITFFFAIAFYFTRSWLVRMEKSIDLKADKSACDLVHKNVAKDQKLASENNKTLFKHKHAKETGEVIIP